MPRKGQPSPRKGQTLSKEWRDNISKGMTGLRVGPNHPLWRGGGSSKYGAGWKRAKRLARERADGKCEHCHRTPEESGFVLDVHHKIPVRYFNTPSDAHALSNLIVLCRRCHAITEHKVDAELPLFAVANVPHHPLPKHTAPIKACPVCGTQFKSTRTRHTYCSRSCLGKATMANRPKPINSGVNLSCPVCGKEFNVRPYRAQSGKTLTCSPSCRASFNNRIRAQR
jgi:hypothetical protein